VSYCSDYSVEIDIVVVVVDKDIVVGLNIVVD
jgi:hypothetical protein